MSTYVCHVCRGRDECLCDGARIAEERDEAIARAVSAEEERDELQQKNAELLLKLANLDSTQICERNALKELIADMKEAAFRLWDQGRIDGHRDTCHGDSDCLCEVMKDVYLIVNGRHRE